MREGDGDSWEGDGDSWDGDGVSGNGRGGLTETSASRPPGLACRACHAPLTAERA